MTNGHRPGLLHPGEQQRQHAGAARGWHLVVDVTAAHLQPVDLHDATLGHHELGRAAVVGAELDGHGRRDQLRGSEIQPGAGTRTADDDERRRRPIAFERSRAPPGQLEHAAGAIGGHRPGKTRRRTGGWAGGQVRVVHRTAGDLQTRQVQQHGVQVASGARRDDLRAALGVLAEIDQPAPGRLLEQSKHVRAFIVGDPKIPGVDPRTAHAQQDSQRPAGCDRRSGPPAGARRATRRPPGDPATPGRPGDPRATRESRAAGRPVLPVPPAEVASAPIGIWVQSRPVLPVPPAGECRSDRRTPRHPLRPVRGPRRHPAGPSTCHPAGPRPVRRPRRHPARPRPAPRRSSSPRSSPFLIHRPR